MARKSDFEIGMQRQSDDIGAMNALKGKYPNSGFSDLELLRKLDSGGKTTIFPFSWANPTKRRTPLEDAYKYVDTMLAGAKELPEIGKSSTPPADTGIIDKAREILKGNPGGVGAEQEQMKQVPGGDVGEPEYQWPLGMLMKFLNRK